MDRYRLITSIVVLFIYLLAMFPVQTIVTTIVMVKEILNVLNDALKSGRNLYESVMDWVSSNKDMSDKVKEHLPSIEELTKLLDSDD